MPKQTPSQTVGPYFAYGLAPAQYGYAFTAIAGGVLDHPDVEGERIRIVGRVLDGAGEAVPDALVEIWQADAHGRYPSPADPRRTNRRFGGFGRVGTGTDPERQFVFDTIRPGAIGDGQAPHVDVVLFARGLPSHLYTRLYFADLVAPNAADPVLAALPAERRATLLAAREGEVGGRLVFRFDIRLQGEHETVFFDA